MHPFRAHLSKLVRIDSTFQGGPENGKVLFESKEGENAFQLQAEAFIAAILDSRLNETPGNVADFIRSPYPDSLNSLAAVLGANVSAGKAGKVVTLYEFTQG